MDDKVISYFRILKKENRIAHSYLFIGRNLALVKDIIKLVICENSQYCNNCWDCNAIDRDIHPDIYIIESENFNISIDKVREAQRFLFLKSFRAKRKVILIKDAETFNLQSANAFLKTLEEPPNNSFIVLCTTNLEAILPTIISRCHRIFLPSVEVKIQPLNTTLIFSFLRGERMNFKERAEFASFLFSMILFFHKFIISILLNNKNLSEKEYEIVSIFKKKYNLFSIKKLIGVLDTILKIYNSYNNINENLAINLLRLELK